MSGILSQILSDAPVRSAGCKTCEFLMRASEEDRAALSQALDNSTIAHSFLAAALAQVGFRVSESSIRRHRKGCMPRERPQGSTESA